MTGPEQRRTGLLVAAVVFLLAVGAGVAPAGVVDQARNPVNSAVSAAPSFGPGPGGAPDTRLQRDPEPGSPRTGSQHEGAGGSPSAGRGPGPDASVGTAVLERAGHPERLGQILRRGPPAPSA